MTGIRNISGTSVPIYAWQSSTATAVMRTSGPERFGGTGDLLKKTEKIKADTDKEWVKEMNRVEFMILLIIPRVLIHSFSYGNV